MRIALAQLGSTTDPQANLVLVRDAVATAAAEGAELVVFPEATMCSFSRRSSEVAEAFDGPWAESVRLIARESGVTVIVGMFTTADDGRVHNTLLVTGEAEVRYDKMHLFDALGYTESRHIAPGHDLVSLPLGDARLGLATCYDIRFPDQFTSLARGGASVIAVCASWAPGPGKVHQWRTLATARAMDSTSYVVAVDQAADGDPDEPGLPTGVGHSMVVDPTGRVLLELGTGPEVALIDLNAELVAETRKALPLLGH